MPSRLRFFEASIPEKEREMQRRDFAWFHPFRGPTCAALAAAIVGAAAGCTGAIGSARERGGTAGTAQTTGAGAGPGVAGASGSTGAGNSAGAGMVTGTAGAAGGGGTPVVFAPSAGAYRRLTSSAFRNSLRDLLAGPVTIGDLEPDSWSVGGFPSVSAATVSISAAGVDQYQTAIDAATSQAFADATRRSNIVGCTPKSATDMTCFQSFVTKFGRLAWRQPLTSAQVTRYTTLIANVAATLGDVNEGLRAGAQGLLLSPNFLYRLERGAPQAGGGNGFWQYTSSEIAARLSYYLTNSTPDATLLDLADQNGLQSQDAVLAQADRLLATAAGRESVGNFARELYQLDLIASRAKDPKFTAYTPALQSAMIQEIPAMFQAIVLDRNASALELLTTRSTFVTKELAALYGLPTTGLSSTSLAAATLPADGLRAGLLTTAGFLSLYANQEEGSPTQRGKFIRQTILCQTIPLPPPNVSTVLPDPPAGVVYTKRQKLAMHEATASCAACHRLMDPLGLTLENFDAIGNYRSTDQGQPIDVSGDLDGTAFNGPVELGQTLAARPEVADCLVRNMYRYGTGHVETATEQPVLDTLKSSFRTGGYHVRDLMRAIVASDGFRFVAPPAP
jgi:Protein of unknown function (DUF1592)/Protein of unknown function (DUF1588)/Protein of unknown function (DUF1585)/Protein of unknown function (DUF1595)/Protein of unknown function (DUF1587)